MNIDNCLSSPIQRKGKALLIIFMSSIMMCNNICSQKLRPKVEDLIFSKHSWGIFVSPLSFVELKNATAAIGIAYRGSAKWEFTAEPGFVYDVWNKNSKTKGARLILTAKRFFSKGRIFFGVDVRAKIYSFNDSQDFLNASTGEELIKYEHRVNTTYTGIAPMFGVRRPISKNKKVVFQINVGLGAKYRAIDRKKIPTGFDLHERFFRAHEWLSPEYYGSPNNGSVTSGFTIYIPSGLRFYYFF